MPEEALGSPWLKWIWTALVDSIAVSVFVQHQKLRRGPCLSTSTNAISHTCVLAVWSFTQNYLKEEKPEPGLPERIPFTWLDQGPFWQRRPWAAPAQIDLDSSPVYSVATLVCFQYIHVGTQKVTQVQYHTIGEWRMVWGSWTVQYRDVLDGMGRP